MLAPLQGGPTPDRHSCLAPHVSPFYFRCDSDVFDSPVSLATHHHAPATTGEWRGCPNTGAHSPSPASQLLRARAFWIAYFCDFVRPACRRLTGRLSLSLCRPRELLVAKPFIFTVLSSCLSGDAICAYVATICSIFSAIRRLVRCRVGRNFYLNDSFAGASRSTLFAAHHSSLPQPVHWQHSMYITPIVQLVVAAAFAVAASGQKLRVTEFPPRGGIGAFAGFVDGADPSRSYAIALYIQDPLGGWWIKPAPGATTPVGADGRWLIRVDVTWASNPVAQGDSAFKHALLQLLPAGAVPLTVLGGPLPPAVQGQAIASRQLPAGSALDAASPRADTSGDGRRPADTVTTLAATAPAIDDVGAVTGSLVGGPASGDGPGAGPASGAQARPGAGVGAGAAGGSIPGATGGGRSLATASAGGATLTITVPPVGNTGPITGVLAGVPIGGQAAAVYVRLNGGGLWGAKPDGEHTHPKHHQRQTLGLEGHHAAAARYRGVPQRDDTDARLAAAATIMIDDQRAVSYHHHDDADLASTPSLDLQAARCTPFEATAPSGSAAGPPVTRIPQRHPSSSPSPRLAQWCSHPS